MKYLLAKEKGNSFELYSPETFGMETWGMTSQTSLEKKNKYWYIHSWSAGNEWIEDINEEYKLNVVLETADLDEILRYVFIHNKAEINHILQEAKEIYTNYFDFLTHYYDYIEK